MSKVIDRETFIEIQTRVVDEQFALTQGEEQAREQFIQMCIDTYDSLYAARPTAIDIYKIYPDGGHNFVNKILTHQYVPAEIVNRWKQWERDYPKLLARNPQLELYDMMGWISEARDCSSWPAGYEAELRDWVDSGWYLPLPFVDRQDIITEQFYARLQELRKLCKGWLFYDDEGNVYFEADA